VLEHLHWLAALLFASVAVRMVWNRSVTLLPWFATYSALLSAHYLSWTPLYARFDWMNMTLCFLKFAAIIEAYRLLVASHFAAERRAGLGMLLSIAFTVGGSQVVLLQGTDEVEFSRFARQIVNTSATAFCLLAALALWIRPVYGVPRALGQHAVTLALFVASMTAVNLLNALMRPRLGGWQTLNLMFWCAAGLTALSWLTAPSLRRRDLPDRA